MGITNQMLPAPPVQALQQRVPPSPQGMSGGNQLTGQVAQQYNQLMQLRPELQGAMDTRAIAANPSALQPMIQATQAYNQMMQTPQGQQLLNNLPAGIDKYAVAANPAAYQQWEQQAKAQEAARPGSTMFAPQQRMPPSPQGMGQALPTTGTFTSPNGTVLNTNPANNAFMAGAANAAKTGYNGLTGNDAAQAWMKANPMGSAPLPTTAPSPQGGKGGQALPSPQALGQGLQQQQAMQNTMQAGKGGQQMPQPNAPRPGQMPMSMQRQPQGGLGGRSMPQQFARRP